MFAFKKFDYGVIILKVIDVFLLGISVLVGILQVALKRDRRISNSWSISSHDDDDYNPTT